MSSAFVKSATRRAESGYALLVVIFLLTLLLLSTMTVAPNILTEGRREKEQDMIWRGKQYVRGVKMYYRKLGRFPTSLDDLTKPKVGSLRFMRQAYKDPMNKEDGSWRLIYVGPAGQLIGSLKPPQQNLQFSQAGNIGTPAAALGSNSSTSSFGAGGANGLFGLAGSQPGSTTPGTAPGTVPGAAAGTTPPGITGAPVSADQGTGSDPSQVPTGDTPTIIGGNIIGVGGKINKTSIIVYEKAKNYRLYEFVWDPSKDNIGVGQPGLQTGNGLGGQPIGQNPLGQQPGQNPAGTGQNPTGTGQNPGGQQPGQNPGGSGQNPQQNPQQP
jgi:hypothetical protein